MILEIREGITVLSVLLIELKIVAYIVALMEMGSSLLLGFLPARATIAVEASAIRVIAIVGLEREGRNAKNPQEEYRETFSKHILL